MEFRIKKNNIIYMILISLFLNTSFSVANVQAKEVYVVEIKKFKFKPNKLKVKLGDTVQFINKDIVPHTATEGVPKREPLWDSNVLNTGEKWEIKLQTIGVIKYFCNFHKSMKGKIIVEK